MNSDEKTIFAEPQPHNLHVREVSNGDCGGRDGLREEHSSAPVSAGGGLGE